ncbi:MAG TPA: hypothetical protein VL463_26340 [Kofleriaceae bacterium]|nr:hypothetical protein [Kofleriaceae bacterium]
MLRAVLVLVIATTAARAGVDQPQAILDRPRTLPAGEAQVSGAVVYTRASPDPAIDDTTSLQLGAGAGLTDAVDVTLMVPLVVRPRLDADTAVLGDVGVTFARGRSSAAAHVLGGWEHGGAPIAPIELGVNAQYLITPRIAIFTGDHELSIALSGDTHPITLALPVGVAFQPAPAVHLQIATKLFELGLRDRDSALIIRDGTPLALRAFVSPSNALDVFATAALIDLVHPRDAFALALGVRLFF